METRVPSRVRILVNSPVETFELTRREVYRSIRRTFQLYARREAATSRDYSTPNTNSMYHVDICSLSSPPLFVSRQGFLFDGIFCMHTPVPPAGLRKHQRLWTLLSDRPPHLEIGTHFELTGAESTAEVLRPPTEIHTWYLRFSH